MTTGSGPAVSVLEESACWALVRSAVIGRLALSIDGRPDVFPVNHVVDHGTIVFRTAEGSKLAALAAGSEVAFEVDGYEAETGEAWSVVVKGSGRLITRPDELLDTTELPLFPWHAGTKPRFVRIVAEEITGRRFHLADRDVWRTELTDAPHAAPE